MSSKIKKLLNISHINVHNANALSSPFTIGFPAMTAWLGATHALQRKLNDDGFVDLKFKSTAVISHMVDLQTFKGVGDYVSSIVGTSNPLGKDGNRPAFIEEARCHLDISLLVEYSGLDIDDEERFQDRVTHHLNSQMKMAGGDIFGFKKLSLHKVKEGNREQLSSMRRQLMPGFAIVERRELMVESMQDGKDAIESLLDYLVVHNCCEKKDQKVIWTNQRKTTGWIVPIAVGFQAISKLAKAKNQRDPNTPHRFAESVVTLGEFIMPYKIESLDEILWHYSVDKEHGLYLCKQNKNR